MNNYKHDEERTEKAIGLENERMEALFDKVDDIFEVVSYKNHEKKSEIIEKIEKILRNVKNKKEHAVIISFILEGVSQNFIESLIDGITIATGEEEPYEPEEVSEQQNKIMYG